MITDHEWERISNEIEKRGKRRKKKSFFNFWRSNRKIKLDVLIFCISY